MRNGAQVKSQPLSAQIASSKSDLRALAQAHVSALAQRCLGLAPPISSESLDAPAVVTATSVLSPSLAVTHTLSSNNSGNSPKVVLDVRSAALLRYSMISAGIAGATFPDLFPSRYAANGSALDRAVDQPVEVASSVNSAKDVNSCEPSAVDRSHKLGGSSALRLRSLVQTTVRLKSGSPHRPTSQARSYVQKPNLSNINIDASAVTASSHSHAGPFRWVNKETI
jgi:hypothetical protein